MPLVDPLRTICVANAERPGTVGARCYGRGTELGLGGHVVLVVGGTGLIGRAVVQPLRAEGAVPISAKAMVFLRVANAVLPLLVAQRGGAVVGVSGQNAFLTGNVTGSVRNAALIITAKNLADAVAGTGVRVNTVNPGTVREDAAAEVAVGSGGEGTPGQVADVITFLVSPRGAGMSGEAIAVGHRVRGASGL